MSKILLWNQVKSRMEACYSELALIYFWVLLIGRRDKIKEIANHCICGIFPTSLNLGRQENSILLLAVFRLQCGALRLWDLGHLWKAFGRRFVVEKYRHLSLCQIAKPWLAGNLDTLGPNSSKFAFEGIKKKWGKSEEIWQSCLPCLSFLSDVEVH